MQTLTIVTVINEIIPKIIISSIRLDRKKARSTPQQSNNIQKTRIIMEVMIAIIYLKMRMKSTKMLLAKRSIIIKENIR